MRMVGAKQSNVHEVSEGLEIPIDEDEEEAEEDAVDEDGDGNVDEASLGTMTTEKMKKAFGRDALLMLGGDVPALLQDL